jgi:hypothetical protein
VEQQLAATQQTPETPYGYCHCGCGQKTTTAKSTDTKKKRTKGKPLRFLPFHHLYVLGPSNPGWKNGRSVQPDKKTKYLLVYKPNHPRTTKKVYVREHILIAEKALGKYLSKRAQVHHINGDGLDNSPNNLLICEDTG